MNKKNNRKQRIENEFNQLQTKIFVRTGIMMFVAVVISYIIYSVFFRGRFANVVVKFLTLYIYKDSEVALDVYWNTIRNYMDLYIILAVLVVFLIIMRIYLKGFIKYFNEINSSIDALNDETSDDVVLSSELASVEKKINSIKHTLAQRKLEAELAEQRKNELVVYLAHDLKTPLTSVIGYLNLLHDEKQISEELREKYLSISLEKAERLEDLINEFFEITRFNLSNITLEYSKVNLTRLLEQLIYESKPMILEKGLKCLLNIDSDINAKCDVEKIQRVFDNLLRNAVNYSIDGGIINIRAMQTDKHISVKFINQGTTISKENLERIFEQFYRLDTARNSKSGGAGLGLAIAKEIVELHGGTITAKSENGEIEFEVTLPLS